MKRYLLGSILVAIFFVTPLFGSTRAQARTAIETEMLISELHAQIAVLLKQIKSLRGSMSLQRSVCTRLDKNIGVGDGSSADLSVLRTVLVQEGIEGAGQLDLGEGLPFDKNYAVAVAIFQKKYGIRQTGFVGPMTRAKMNELYRCAPSPAVPTSESIPALAVMSTPHPKITIVSPNGREAYDMGTVMPIRFTAELGGAQTSGVTLQLYEAAPSENSTDYTYVQDIVRGWTGGSPYKWTVPFSLEEGRYVIRVSPDDEEGDFSDGSFLIFLQ